MTDLEKEHSTECKDCGGDHPKVDLTEIIADNHQKIKLLRLAFFAAMASLVFSVGIWLGPVVSFVALFAYLAYFCNINISFLMGKTGHLYGKLIAARQQAIPPHDPSNPPPGSGNYL